MKWVRVTTEAVERRLTKRNQFFNHVVRFAVRRVDWWHDGFDFVRSAETALVAHEGYKLVRANQVSVRIPGFVVSRKYHVFS